MDKGSISADALETLKSCDKIYLENYTVNFPYRIKDLKIKVTELSREQIESEEILKEAKNKEIALLVYGDALSATTHIQLILEAKKQKIPYKIFHNASIIIAVAETGLSLYKFGKTTSMPNWTEHTNKPTSFTTYIKQNQSIEAHTLLLTDINLNIKDAITQLQEASKNIKLPKKIIALSNAGTPNQKIFYDTLSNLENKNIKMPFCLIIPSDLHFTEKEFLESTL